MAAASPTPFSVSTLSAIQPGLGTVMIEYGRRMGSAWFAGEACNWDKFESAYNAAIQGCNSCHGSQTSADFAQGFQFVKIQTPKDTLDSIYNYSP